MRSLFFVLLSMDLQLQICIINKYFIFMDKKKQTNATDLRDIRDLSTKQDISKTNYQPQKTM